MSGRRPQRRDQYRDVGAATRYFVERVHQQPHQRLKLAVGPILHAVASWSRLSDTVALEDLAAVHCGTDRPTTHQKQTIMRVLRELDALGLLVVGEERGGYRGQRKTLRLTLPLPESHSSEHEQSDAYREQSSAWDHEQSDDERRGPQPRKAGPGTAKGGARNRERRGPEPEPPEEAEEYEKTRGPDIASAPSPASTRAADGAPQAAPTGAASSAATKRERCDEIRDTLVAVAGYDESEITRSQQDHLKKLASELVNVGATPQEVEERWRRYGTRHPTWTRTPSALVNHWSTLGGPHVSGESGTDAYHAMLDQHASDDEFFAKAAAERAAAS